MSDRKKLSAADVSLCGVLSALCVALLYISGLSEIASLSVLAVAGFFIAVAVAECGVAAGTLAYAASGLLALLICPDKINAAMFLIFFGLYPTVKSLSETVLKSRVAEWAVKFIFCNVALAVMLIGALVLTVDVGILGRLTLWMKVLACVALNAVFLLYDVALTRLMTFYLFRISPKIRRNSHK